MEDLVKKTLRQYGDFFAGDAGCFRPLAEQLAGEPGDLTDRSNMKGHVTASALVLDQQLESLLVIEHKSLNKWLPPGGHVDPGESLVCGARRELMEETGLRQVMLARWHEQTGLPIDIDSHVIPPNPAKGEGEHHHHDFMYVFHLTAEKPIELQAEEVSAYRWISLSKVGSTNERLARAVRKLDLVLSSKPTVSRS